MALTATAGLLGSQLIVGIVALYHPTYSPEPWHQFLIYLAYTFIMAAVNAFGTALLPLFNKFAVSWSIAGFTIISITVLACAAPDYNSAKFVFTNFNNTTGWPDGRHPSRISIDASDTGVQLRTLANLHRRGVATRPAARGSLTHRL